MKQHSSRFLTLVAHSKKRITAITPLSLHEKIANKESFCLIDVREDHEWVTGHIAGAIHKSKGIIERDIEKEIPDTQTAIVLYCSGGFRSILVADSLQQMGYRQVYSLDSGLSGWVESGYTIEK